MSESMDESPPIPMYGNQTAVPDAKPLLSDSIMLEILCTKVDRMQETMDAILLKFDGIASEVGPMVDAVSAHPLFKMIIPKGRG